MSHRTIPITSQTHLILESVAGDLVLKGWGREDMQLNGDNELFSMEDDSDRIQVNCRADLSLTVPHQLNVTLHNLGGDGSLSNLTGDLEIGKVGGDLSLRDVNQARIEGIAGDLLAKHIRGDLTIRNLGGDCVVSDLDQQLSTKGTGGDLLVSEVGGGIDAAASGDIHARFSPVPWQTYALESQGDMYIQVPSDCHATFLIHSQQESITLQIGDDAKRIQGKETTFEVGEGGPQIQLSAAGEVTLSDTTGQWSPELTFDADLKGLAGQITQQTSAQIQDQLSTLEKHLEQHLSGVAKSLEGLDLPPEKIAHIQSKIEGASQRAAQKVQKATRKAEAKLEKHIAQAQKKARRQRPPFNLDEFLSQQEHAPQSATDEERLMILNMLQEKKITAEQAEDLLSALEGGQDQ